MIRAYPRQPSHLPGERLVLHLSTTSPQFSVRFYRQGARLERVQGMDAVNLPGINTPDGPPDVDWGWPGYEFTVPDTWPSGVYIAMLSEVGDDGSEKWPDDSTPDGTSAKVMFVIRNPNPDRGSQLLYKVSWATFAAYNGTGYGSLYTEAVWSREQPHPGFKVTWRRPGCGTGGEVMPGDSIDVYDPRSRRQTFTHWDAPFISWLESNGYRPDYCTDYDLHRDESLLAPYNLMLSTGHDEYWSDRMRAHLEAYVKRGGNVMFLSGNISGYRIHFTDDDTAFTCAKVGPPTKDPDHWQRDAWQYVNPENRITGVGSAHGGGWWDGYRDPQGYRVQHSGHWVYSGTGLRDGDEFGADPDFPLIGYEVDGAEFRWKHDLAVATGANGTPADFFILGLAELTEGWVSGHARPAATMGIYTSPRGGIVFQGATTDWPILVPRDRHVGQITKNLLDRLSLGTVRIVGPLPAKGGRMLAAASETVTFHADTSDLGFGPGLEYRWEVAGGIAEAADGVQVLVTVDAEPGLTVAVTVLRDGKPVGFGSKTLLALSVEEGLRLELLIHMREIVMPGEPSNPMVSPTSDPLSRSWLLYTIRVPWIQERAQRLERAAGRLIEEREAIRRKRETDGQEDH